MQMWWRNKSRKIVVDLLDWVCYNKVCPVNEREEME